MIYKLCAVCQKYFAGELDGAYVCPACRAQGAVAAPVAVGGLRAGVGGGTMSSASAPNAPRAA